MNAEQYRALVRKLESINEDPLPGTAQAVRNPPAAAPAPQPAETLSPDQVWAKLQYSDKAFIMKILQDPDNSNSLDPDTRALIAQSNTQSTYTAPAGSRAAGMAAVRSRGNQGQGNQL